MTIEFGFAPDEMKVERDFLSSPAGRRAIKAAPRPSEAEIRQYEKEERRLLSAYDAPVSADRLNALTGR